MLVGKEGILEGLNSPEHGRDNAHMGKQSFRQLADRHSIS